jgi:hypothetical protein
LDGSISNAACRNLPPYVKVGAEEEVVKELAFFELEQPLTSNVPFGDNSLNGQLCASEH